MKFPKSAFTNKIKECKLCTKILYVMVKFWLPRK